MTNPPVEMPENEIPKIAGDWLDDDPAVVDDLVRNQSDPPLPDDLPMAFDSLPDTKPTPISKFMARNYKYPASLTDPIMLLPADAKRKRLIIRVDATCVISSDRNDLVDGANNAFQCIAYEIYDLTGHTGALWVAPYSQTNRVVGSTGNFTVSILAVTE